MKGAHMQKAGDGWFKVYTRLLRSAPVIEHGHEVAHVYMLLLALAREHGRTGDIDAGLCTPRALKRNFCADAYDEETFQRGLDGCEAAGWIKNEGGKVVVTGYRDEYGEPPQTAAQRKRKSRAKKRGVTKSHTQNVTQRDGRKGEQTQWVKHESAPLVKRPEKPNVTNVTHVTAEEKRREEKREEDIVVFSPVRERASAWADAQGGAVSLNNKNNNSLDDEKRRAIRVWYEHQGRRGISENPATVRKVVGWVEQYGSDVVCETIEKCHLSSKGGMSLGYVEAALKNKAAGVDARVEKKKKTVAAGHVFDSAPSLPLDTRTKEERSKAFEEAMERVKNE